MLFLICLNYFNLYAMKYRRLSNEELAELEDDFVKFLAANTVTADDWEKIKKEDPDKTEGLINMFSDIVFEQIMTNIELLEHRSKEEITYLRFKQDKIEMIGVKLDGESDIDFTNLEDAQVMIEKAQKAKVGLSVYSADKEMQAESRNQEIFRYLKSGSMICENTGLYEALLKFKKPNPEE